MRTPHWLPIFAVTLALLLCSGPALASIIHVPGDQPSIQAGLAAAAPGDSVLVAAGTYFERLYMPSLVTLCSEAGAAATIIDGQSVGAVVRCHGAAQFVIDGFTLRNGDHEGGGGVDVRNGNGTIRNCMITANVSSLDGGGISIAASSLEIDDCTITANQSNVAANLDGGGVYCWQSTMILQGSLIADNVAQEGGGVAVVGNSLATIRWCTFAHNTTTSPGHSGGAMSVDTSFATVEDNTFVATVTPSTGATMIFDTIDSTFMWNIVAHSSGVGLWCTSSIPTGCNDVWASQNVDYQGCSPAPTDFSADPEFCDLAQLDLTLHQASPCAPGHSPAGCGLIGAFNVGCGPVAVEPASWGAVKATFRR